MAEEAAPESVVAPDEVALEAPAETPPAEPEAAAAAPEEETKPAAEPEAAAAEGDAAAAKETTAAEEEEEEPKPPSFDWMPEGCAPMADGEYDAIVLGTGLKECILSGLLATKGMKVLVVDRNNYYGGEAASLNLTNLFGKFNKGAEPPQQFFDILGHNRDYNVDLIPKCIMACGKLVKMLLHTKVTRYLEFKSIDASYVQRTVPPRFGDLGGPTVKLFKVPTNGEEALRALAAGLLGIFETRRFTNFMKFLAQYDAAKPETHKGNDLRTMTMKALFDHYSLEASTVQFVGHAMALQIDDSYLDKPAIQTVEQIQLYCYSLDRYGKSPFLYPMYGLGGLPEGFSRLCAINGGTFMLNRPVDEIMFDEATGAAWGVRGKSLEGEGGPDEVAKAAMIIGDPSYFLPYGKVKAVGRVTRAICLMDHPIAHTNDVDSVQVILPAKDIGRKFDIYVMMVSSAHCVAGKGKYVAIVSTTVETNDPKSELEPGIKLLGKVIARFDSVADSYEPTNDSAADKCFISQTYDATSHFGTSSDDVLDLYRRITGTELDMNINADNLGGDY